MPEKTSGQDEQHMRIGCLPVASFLGWLVVTTPVAAASQRDYEDCGVGNPNNQIAACSRIIGDHAESNSNVALAHIKRGQVYQQQKDYDRAIADFTQAINYNRDVYYLRGLAYSNKNDYSHAVAEFTEAIKRNPKHAWAYYERGLAYCNMFKYEIAIDNFVMAARADTDFDIGESIYPLTCMTKENYRRAIMQLADQIRLNPKDYVAYNVRGALYEVIDNYPAALADFSKAVELNEKYSGAYYNRGRTYARMREYDRAIADFSEVIGISPDSSSAYRERGDVYAHKGDKDHAIADFYDGAAAAGRATQKIKSIDRFQRAPRRR